MNHMEKRVETFQSSPVKSKFTPDNGPGKHRIGLVLLSNDYAAERDFMNVRPNDDVALFFSRVPNDSECTLATLPRMAPHITTAAKLIIPEGRLDVIAYACTSGTVVMGFDKICKQIHAVRPRIPVVTPITAAIKAFEYLNVSKLAVLTPYEDNVNDKIAKYLINAEIEISAFTSFRISDNELMAALPTDAIFEAGLEADRPDAEALFISCTAIRALEVVQRLETAIRKPVITANQAMIWQSLRLSGFNRPVSSFGKLLQKIKK